MLRSFLKIAVRNMSSQTMYTAIKIGGFALGLATCIMIALYIRLEISYDSYYENKDRIFRVYNEMIGPENQKWTSFPAPFTDLVKESIPEVELAARLIPYAWYNAGNNLIRSEEKADNIYEEGFAYADADLLEILEVPMVYGNRNTALRAPNTIVISKPKSDKLFPNEDPTGKVIILNDDINTRYTIGGVMEDFPANSHLQFDFLLTLSGKEFWPGEQTSWCCWNYNPYVRLAKEANAKDVEMKFLKIKEAYIEHLINEKNQLLNDVKRYHFFRLQPVNKIHLYSDKINDIVPHGDIRYIYMFGAAAVFILLLACINFVNLSTARSANRAREVGLRKVVGSYRSSLIEQFLSESIIFSFASFLIALILLWLSLPYFNSIAGTNIVVPWNAWWFYLSLFVGAILIGVLAGLYPSFYLSAFKPIDVLKGSVARGMKHSKLRSAMVVFQFTTSIVLIVGTFVIYQQMQFILTKKVGYDREQVLMIHGVNTLERQMQTFKSELKKVRDVQNVTLTQYLPVDGTKRDNNPFWHEGKREMEKSIGAQIWYVDEDYISTLGMRMVDGRNFDQDLASDSSAVIINESMSKALGFSDPVGEKIVNNRMTFHIIGVVEDFHFQSMQGKIGPLCFGRGNWGNIASVKLKTANVHGAIEDISAVWNKFMPHQAIRYSFLDEAYARMYEDVRRTGNIFVCFAVLAIIVACLGLFALSAFMVEQRTKEISIRLVLGASLRSVFHMLTNQFVKLVALSFLLAVPISWYIMQQWLQDYEYRIDLGWQVFLLAGAVALVIALLTVSYQSIRAALINPAVSLKSE